jgi:hypothetical protein
MLHHNKKLNKQSKKLHIQTVLTSDSINAQLIPSDALRKTKFKSTWPYSKDNTIQR